MSSAFKSKNIAAESSDPSSGLASSHSFEPDIRTPPPKELDNKSDGSSPGVTPFDELLSRLSDRGENRNRKRPYDPVTNYLSPRPRFLRYKPYKRRGTLLSHKGEYGDENSALFAANLNKNAHAEPWKQSRDDGSEETPAGEVLLMNEREEIRRRKKDDDEKREVALDHDDDAESEEAAEERQGWGFKRLLKFLLLVAVLVFSSVCISPINNSPAPSTLPLDPAFQAATYHLGQRQELDEPEGFAEQGKGTPCEGVVNGEGPVEVQEEEAAMEDDETAEQRSGGGSFYSGMDMEGEEQAKNLQLQTAHLEFLEDMEGEEQAKNLQLQRADVEFLEAELNTNASESIHGHQFAGYHPSLGGFVDFCPTPYGKSVRNFINLTFHEEARTQYAGDEETSFDYEEKQRGLIQNVLESVSLASFVGSLIISALALSSVAVILRRRTSKRSPPPPSKAMSETETREEIGTPVVDKEKADDLFSTSSSLLESAVEDRRGPIELLGEIVVSEMSRSTLRSCAENDGGRKVTAAEGSDVTGSRKKGVQRRGIVVPMQVPRSLSPSQVSAMDSPRYSSFTPQTSVMKKKGMGEKERKGAATATPIRRSSRIKNRATSR